MTHVSRGRLCPQPSFPFAMSLSLKHSSDTSLAEASSQSGSQSGSIGAEIERKMRSTGPAALQRIRCNVEEDALAVFGNVQSFREKQFVQEMLKKLEPRLRIENMCEVTQMSGGSSRVKNHDAVKA